LLNRDLDHAAITGGMHRVARRDGRFSDGGGLEFGRARFTGGSGGVRRVDARVQVVDTRCGLASTERFDATPIRIGRAPGNDLFLPHRSIAALHGEIAIGPRFAYFRSRAWLRASRIDGVRVKRGRTVKLTPDSVISLGPFEVTVWFRVRDRRYERERKVTPLALDGACLEPRAQPRDPAAPQSQQNLLGSALVR
jgi:hypothetical protein